MTGPEDATYHEARWIADLIRAEDNLVTQRTGWNLTAQTLLIAGLALAEDGFEPSIDSVVKLVPWLGLLFAALTLISIRAAFLQIDHLMMQWSSTENGRDQRFSALGLIAPFGDSEVHFMGKVTPFGIPLGFAAFWLILLFKQACT